ncbi:hypothetical protein X474_26520 [Dethiosulfatarculus sandiegensis]|uniref:Uncharacterized protein n=1 Tax=Dethiosulfatarculus sandiegensis TaxID=1429043 RepID=A0A0D2G7Q2_9BACT|nr:hypothetical protein X474_26520 [Dethiosulfatarculus sandiegensis]
MKWFKREGLGGISKMGRGWFGWPGKECQRGKTTEHYFFPACFLLP